jgi:hypothetical protein
VRHPEDTGETEGKLEISTEIVVIQRFVKPISVSEDNTAHLNNTTI